MAYETKQISSMRAMQATAWRLAGPALLCTALAGATAPAHAQADPACYVVNQVLLWLQPQAALIECARTRAPASSAGGVASTTPAPGNRAVPASAAATPHQVPPAIRRQP